VDEGRRDYLYAKSKKDRPQDPFDGKIKLSSFIDDPHQKFYYTFNFDRPFDFHVELMKIILDDTPALPTLLLYVLLAKHQNNLAMYLTQPQLAAETPMKISTF
jgi:hypothetical protein